MYAQAGDQQRAVEHLAACFAGLDRLHTDGRDRDAGMRQLHTQLAAMFKA